MSKPLVIVESPAKAKTIAKFLGDGYDVRASVGHIADLPSKDVLRAKLLGLLQTPASQFVRVLNEPASSLARVLKAKADALGSAS
mgnify:CR=1 FL=1